MMIIIKYIVTILIITVLPSGCATKYAAHYSPVSSLSGRGNIVIDRFRYIPADEKVLEPNQVEKNGVGVYLDENIDIFITDAVYKELKFVGYAIIGNSTKVITGEVMEFSMMGEGIFEYAFVTKIKYFIYVIEGHKKIEIYSRIHEGKVIIPVRNMSISMDNYLYKSLSLSIDDFIRQAQKDNVL